MFDLRDATLPAAAVIEALGLQPHPEGGHYRETWRDVPADGGRGAGTAIHYLLRENERSHWHRVDAAELWVWQGGAPLTLSISRDGRESQAWHLGPDLAAGQQGHAVVPQGHWQAAASQGGWSLLCCVVAPAFRFAGFELAPEGWQPGS